MNDGVALRKESVDRNAKSLFSEIYTQKSLSARRAWIEMTMRRSSAMRGSGRSPQGERG